MNSNNQVVCTSALLLLLGTMALFPAYPYGAKLNQHNGSASIGRNSSPDADTQLHANIDLDFKDYVEKKNFHEVNTTEETVVEGDVLPPAGIAALVVILCVVAAIVGTLIYGCIKNKKEKRRQAQKRLQQEAGQAETSPNLTGSSEGDRQYQRDLKKAFELDEKEQQESGYMRHRRRNVQDVGVDLHQSGESVPLDSTTIIQHPHSAENQTEDTEPDIEVIEQLPDDRVLEYVNEQWSVITLAASDPKLDSEEGSMSGIFNRFRKSIRNFFSRNKETGKAVGQSHATYRRRRQQRESGVFEEVGRTTDSSAVERGQYLTSKDEQPSNESVEALEEGKTHPQSREESRAQSSDNISEHERQPPLEVLSTDLEACEKSDVDKPHEISVLSSVDENSPLLHERSSLDCEVNPGTAPKAQE